MGSKELLTPLGTDLLSSYYMLILLFSVGKAPVWYNVTCLLLSSDPLCQDLMGYLAVYKLSMAAVAFHILLFLLTLGVKKSGSCRGGIHNGYWGIKILFFVGLLFLFFRLPFHSNMKYVTFAWMVACAGGGLGFVFLQTMLLIEFMNSLTDRCMGRLRCSPCIANFGSLVLGVFIYGVAILGGILELKYLVLPPHSQFSFIVILSHIALILILGFFSVLPCSAHSTGGMGSGLVQASAISLYILYLTWNALVSKPQEDDSPQSLPTVLMSYAGLIIMFLTIINTVLDTSSGRARSLGIGGVPDERNTTLWFCCLRACLKPNSRVSAAEEEDQRAPPARKVSSYGQRMIHDEAKQSTYSYPLFHLLLILAYFYASAQLTHWFRPREAELLHFNRNWTSVWMKLSSAWICAVVFTFTLLAPEVCVGNLNRPRYRQQLSRLSAAGTQETPV
ncbi:unnamed protein product [Darwinula stevensoni]|uniref:Serine incorporator 5 n=1 Tax=Darwinula stevensoni TaxID=69355 RepID=A0A7R8WZX3_9CRUS|nr:unnamed protein product [Darwinula stevensoni]CAG0881050.1 unnamed protein product [Darwinula stevensoni]